MRAPSAESRRPVRYKAMGSDMNCKWCGKPIMQLVCGPGKQWDHMGPNHTLHHHCRTGGRATPWLSTVATPAVDIAVVHDPECESRRTYHRVDGVIYCVCCGGAEVGYRNNTPLLIQTKTSPIERH